MIHIKCGHQLIHTTNLCESAYILLMLFEQFLNRIDSKRESYYLDFHDRIPNPLAARRNSWVFLNILPYTSDVFLRQRVQWVETRVRETRHFRGQRKFSRIVLHNKFIKSWQNIFINRLLWLLIQRLNNPFNLNKFNIEGSISAHEFFVLTVPDLVFIPFWFANNMGY